MSYQRDDKIVSDSIFKRKVINFIFFWIFLTNVCILCSLTYVAHASDKVVYNSHERRDPFKPLLRGKKIITVVSGLYGVESVDQIRLEGLVYDPQRGSLVIANDTVLGEGESEADVKVLEIKEDGVVFEILGKIEFKPFSPELATKEKKE